MHGAGMTQAPGSVHVACKVRRELCLRPAPYCCQLCCLFLPCVCAWSVSCVQLFLTPSTVAPSPPVRLLCPWNSPGKNTGVGCHFLLQRIFLTQGWNLRLLHRQPRSLQSKPPGKPIFLSCSGHADPPAQCLWGGSFQVCGIHPAPTQESLAAHGHP